MGNTTDKGIFGIHHVTAIASDPQRNIDFYTNNLGLRLVKITVNHDDPTTYHLYYGDELRTSWYHSHLLSLARCTKRASWNRRGDYYFFSDS